MSGKKKPEKKKSQKKERNGTTHEQKSVKSERTKHEIAFSKEAKDAARQFSWQIIQGGLHSLRLKYAEMRAFVPADPSKKAFDANQLKCRYKDVPCWDKSRVVLSWPNGYPGDFVHANKITHELIDPQQYICCQGPLDTTVPDFWRCVWQEKVRHVIMLCRCEELGKNKCAQYWPKEAGETMTLQLDKPLIIKCDKVDTSDRSFVHTKLSLTYDKETRQVHHRQWTSWPDKSVPKTPMAPFRILQHARKTKDHHPTVIHCSAGVGRTGTLVVIELIFRSLVKGKVPDVAQLVKDVRSQRSFAVQTEDQYLYCHYAILLLLHIKKIVPSHFVKHYVKEYESYLKLLNDVGGKNLPMEATSLPQPCANCTSIAAHLQDSKTIESPPSETHQEKAKESRRETRDKNSKRESKKKNKDNDDDHRKATVMKQLKTQREKKKKGAPKKSAAEPKGDLNETTMGNNNQTYGFGGTLAMPTGYGTEHQSPLTPTSPETPKQATPEEAKAHLPPPVAASAEPAHQNLNNQQQQQASPVGTPQAVEQQQPVSPPASPAQQHQEFAPSQPQMPQQQQTPDTNGWTPPGAAVPTVDEQWQQQQHPNFQYQPSPNYTVQEAGGEKKAIVYHRNTKPLVKAIATPAGVPQPQCFVMGSIPPQQSPGSTPQQQQPPPPPQTPAVGVPFLPPPQY